jgi:hypothetical protein
VITLRHGGATGEGGTGPGAFAEPQALTAWEQQRALTQMLMEEVAGSANLNQAHKRVKANKGAAGVDAMSIAELLPWIRENRERVIASLLDGSYQPQTVRGVEIPKPGGGTRQLGIPTVVDRLVQQSGSAPPVSPPFSIIAQSASTPAATHNRSTPADTSSQALPTAPSEPRQSMSCNSLHGVAFLSWNRHPEPTGSRQATPLLLFQHVRRGNPSGGIRGVNFAMITDAQINC